MKGSFSRSVPSFPIKTVLLFFTLLLPFLTSASSGNVPSVGPIRVEFIIFGLILAGVALFHHQTFRVAVAGVTVLLIFKTIFDPGFHFVEHVFGQQSMLDQLMDKSLRQGEWGILLNLLGLLLGFAILAKIFEESGVPEVLPKVLPNDW